MKNTNDLTKRIIAVDVEMALKKFANAEKAKLLAGFFKTGKGQYGEGDVFWGVMVPQTRQIVKQFNKLPLVEVGKLLLSPIHEVRLCAILILVHQFEFAEDLTRKQIVRFYLNHTKYINNWDLVDLSAPKILGEWLVGKDKKILYKLAKSKNIWERRIAVLSSFAFVARGDSTDALKISKMLLTDTHDLIHKSVGWMLREVGKRCSRIEEEGFLKKYYRAMPRTMLRYSLEHFPKTLRKKYMRV